MITWLLIISVLSFSEDDGALHRHYQVRDHAFSSKKECEDALYRRTHTDYIEGGLQIACVAVPVDNGLMPSVPK